MPETENRLLGDAREPARTTVEAYRGRSGYTALHRATSEMTTGQVIGQIREAGLRGRTGQGQDQQREGELRGAVAHRGDGLAAPE